MSKDLGWSPSGRWAKGQRSPSLPPNLPSMPFSVLSHKQTQAIHLGSMMKSGLHWASQGRGTAFVLFLGVGILSYILYLSYVPNTLIRELSQQPTRWAELPKAGSWPLGSLGDLSIYQGSGGVQCEI